MDKKEFSEYNRTQMEEINKHKWIESEKAGKDLGQDCCLEWISLYAEKFRSWWESSHKENDQKSS